MTGPRKDEYTLDDLARFSPWPARLLGLEPWTRSSKTPSEVTREFDRDKWGSLLARYKASGGASISTVEEWMLDPDATLCSIGDQFELLSPRAALDRHIEVVAQTLLQQLPAPAIVELGAGFGSVIVRLAQDVRFRGASLFAGEYTNNGLELLRRLASDARVIVQSAYCDLSSDPIIELPVPPGAVVFTCMAAHYVPELKEQFVRALHKLRAKVIVHFEPCHEHCDTQTVSGLLRRRYIEINDYNRNLVTLLHSHAAGGQIQILQERPGVIGVNPLLPISIVAWRSAHRGSS